MKTISIKNKSKCYPVTLISITKVDDNTNDKVKAVWSNPYNMVVTGQVAIDYSFNGNSWFLGGLFPIQDLQGIVDTPNLGVIADGTQLHWRARISTIVCGELVSNIITMTWVKIPIVIYNNTGSTYIEYAQGSYRNWPVPMPNLTNIITQTGTYKIEFDITKNHNVSFDLYTAFRLAKNVSSISQIQSVILDPSQYIEFGTINAPQGQIQGEVIVNLQANEKLLMHFYMYTGGYMHITINCKLKISLI